MDIVAIFADGSSVIAVFIIECSASFFLRHHSNQKQASYVALFAISTNVVVMQMNEWQNIHPFAGNSC
jgi:hypothetical protein